MLSMNDKVTQELEIVDKIRDGLGKPVDKKIRLLVAALRVHKFITTGSCAGHSDGRTPYLDISSNESLEFENNNEVERVIKLMSKDYSNVKYQKEYAELCKIPKASNLKEANSLLTLVEEFYSKRIPNSGTRLIISSIGDEGLGGYRLHPTGDFVIKLKEKNERLKWLKSAQEEIDAFTGFLFDKLDHK